MSQDFPQDDDIDEDGECHRCEVCDFTKCTYQTEIDKAFGEYPYRENPDGSFGVNIFEFDEMVPELPSSTGGLSKEGSDQAAALQLVPLNSALAPLLEIPARIVDPNSPSDSIVAPIPPREKRKRGAPRGNVNAYKHGLYAQDYYVCNTTPVECAKLYDLNLIIEKVKKRIVSACDLAETLTTVEEIDNNLRTICFASMSLTRLIHTHDRFRNSGLDVKVSGESSARRMLEFYQKKVNTFMDLTESEEQRGREGSI